MSQAVRNEPQPDPVLLAFASEFGEVIRRQLLARYIEPTKSLQQNIRLLAGCDRPLLKKVLSQAVQHMLNTRQVNLDQYDAMVHLARFVYCHLRLPSNRMLFNDVLFRMKISGELETPLRARVTDKELAKQFIAEQVGDENNVPTLAILRSDEEVDAYDFPASCVIKPTHSCNKIIIRRQGDEIEKDEIKDWFRGNYYDYSREANYRNLVPKVIVEPIVFGGRPHLEFKAFCWNGRPLLYFSQTGQGRTRRRVLYDADWRELNFSLGVPKLEVRSPLPLRATDITALAAKLSAPFNFIRVDFYSDGEGLFVGELTSCHGSANQAFIPRGAELEASRLLFLTKGLRQHLPRH